MRSRTLFIITVGLVVLGIVSIALQPVLDPRPDSRCVAEGRPSSGFVDEDSDCSISQDSWEEISDWESSPKPFRIAGLVLIVAGIAAGIVGVVRGRRGPDQP